MRRDRIEGSQTSLFNITIKEFKEYLNKFNEEDNISLIVLDTEKRKCFKHREIFLLEDQPAIILIQMELRSIESNDNEL